MARWLMLGCFGFLIFLGIAGWAAWAFIVRPAQALVNDFRQVIELDKRVQNQKPYAATAPLSKAQVLRFVAVQQAVRLELGERYQRIEQRLNQLAGLQNGSPTLDYRAALDLFKDSGTLVVDAKQIQVAALNAQRFSAEEYSWVKSQVYAALGYGLPKLDPQEILRQIGAGDFQPKVDLSRPETTKASQALVEPYRERLVAYYPFTWFGL